MNTLYSESMVYSLLPKFIIQALSHHGIDQTAFLADVGVEPHELGSIEKSISLDKLSIIFERAIQVTQNPDISFYAARIAYTNILRLQLHMSTMCTSFREYLNLMPSALKIFGDIGEVVVLRDSQENIKMVWEPLFPEKMNEYFYADFFLGLASLMVGSLCSRPISVVSAALSCPPTAESSIRHSIFGSNFGFTKESCYLNFDSEVLDYQLVKLEIEHDNTSDYSVTRLFEGEIIDDPFLAQLRKVVVRQLPKGKINIDAIAADLGTSRRSLQRRLSDRNKKFSYVLSDIRSQLALRYLGDLQLSISDVAFLLGYVDQGAFTKVFKVWYGKTPRAYRQYST